MRLHLASKASLGEGRAAKGFEKDRALVGLARQHGPGLFGGEAEEGRHPAQHGVGDLVQRGLGAAARQALGRGGVEAVLEHVEVERAQVFRAIHLQLAHHGVELVDVEVLEHLGLEFGCARQGVAVDLQHLVQRHGVGGGDRNR